jgi:hypothetical protein
MVSNIWEQCTPRGGSNRVICYVVPSFLPIVVPSSCYCYPLSIVCTHPTSTTLFPVLSKKGVLVPSFEYLTDNSNMCPQITQIMLLGWLDVPGYVQ